MAISGSPFGPDHYKMPPADFEGAIKAGIDVDAAVREDEHRRQLLKDAEGLGIDISLPTNELEEAVRIATQDKRSGKIAESSQEVQN